MPIGQPEWGFGSLRLPAAGPVAKPWKLGRAREISRGLTYGRLVELDSPVSAPQVRAPEIVQALALWQNVRTAAGITRTMPPLGRMTLAEIETRLMADAFDGPVRRLADLIDGDIPNTLHRLRVKPATNIFAGFERDAVGLSDVSRLEPGVYVDAWGAALNNARPVPAPVLTSDYGPDGSAYLLRSIHRAADICTTGKGTTSVMRAPELTLLSAAHTTVQQNAGGTLLDGVVSVAQALALLTTHKVAGFEDHIELMSAVVEGGALSEFTHLVPVGVVGPLALTGMRFAGAVLAPGGPGGVQLDPEFRAYLVAQHAMYKHAALTGDKSKIDVDPHKGAGGGCPAMRAPTRGALPGVPRLGQALVDWMFRERDAAQ